MEPTERGARDISTADLTGARWRTSSYSGNSGNCVEVARAGHLVGLRDSKSRSAGTLAVPAESWHAFLGRFTGGPRDA